MIMRYRYFFTALLSLVSYHFLQAQSSSDGLYVNGKNLFDYCGDTIILRGINYPVLDDWEFPQTSEVSGQIAQTGANTVRISWYMNYGQASRPAYGLKDLDTVLTRITRLKMIPVLELHDLTCQTGYEELNTVILPWYTQPSVLALLQKHKRNLILNLVNEYGFVRWASNPALARTSYRLTYQTLVQGLRSAGLHIPLMIDAPDCGTSLSVLVSEGAALQQSDPDHNLIFSVHTYWYGYTGNDSIAMRTELQTALNAQIPLVLGEVATQQDDQTNCQYNLNYKAILRMAQEMNLGWLIWAWYKDNCPARKISTNGSFASLTPFGNEIVHDPVFGLQPHAVRSEYLLQNGVCATGTEPSFVKQPVILYPNPAKNQVTVLSGDQPGSIISLHSMDGRKLKEQTESQILNLDGIAPGLYRISVGGRSVMLVKE